MSYIYILNIFLLNRRIIYLEKHINVETNSKLRRRDQLSEKGVASIADLNMFAPQSRVQGWHKASIEVKRICRAC